MKRAQLLQRRCSRGNIFYFTASMLLWEHQLSRDHRRQEQSSQWTAARQVRSSCWQAPEGQEEIQQKTEEVQRKGASFSYRLHTRVNEMKFLNDVESLFARGKEIVGFCCQ